MRCLKGLIFNVNSPGHGRPGDLSTINPGSIQEPGRTRSPLVIIG